MLRTRQRLLKLQYMILDIFAIQICSIVCTHIFKKVLLLNIASSLKGSFFNVSVIAFSILAFILLNVYNEDVKLKSNSIKKFFKIAIIITISVILSEITVRLVNSNKGMGEKFLLAYAIGTIFLLCFVRVILPFLNKNFNDGNTLRVLLVGTGQGIQNYHHYSKEYDSSFSKIVGYIQDEKIDEMDQLGVDYIGDYSEFDNIIENHIVDKVVLEKAKVPEEKIQSIIKKCKSMGIVVLVMLEPYLSEFDGWQKVIVSDIPAVRYSIAKLNSGQLFLKRIIDIMGSLVGLVIFSLSFIIFAPMIKLGSKGPVLFKQTRVGRNGRRFNILKYRTMSADAESRKEELVSQNKMSGQIFKIENDPRITKLGKFLRKTSIDELPQFINVFKGDMSLVGTRPPTLDEVAEYEDRHYVRLSVTSGITGNWQVNGRSDIVDFEQIVEMDKEYIVNWTIWQDVRIIFKTIEILFKRKGAY